MESWAKLQEQTRKGEYVQEEDGIQVLILSHLSEEFLWDLALSLEHSEDLSSFGVVPLVVLKALLRPLEFHPRLVGEIPHHPLLLLREDGLEGGA